jgi:hypothetical protein
MNGVIAALDIVLPVLLVFSHDRSGVRRIRSVRHLSLYLYGTPVNLLDAFSLLNTPFAPIDNGYR